MLGREDQSPSAHPPSCLEEPPARKGGPPLPLLSYPHYQLPQLCGLVEKSQALRFVRRTDGGPCLLTTLNTQRAALKEGRGH